MRHLRPEITDCFDDKTADANWLEEHTERLLGFEIMRMWVSGSPYGFEPELLSDKIGMHKGYPYLVIKSIQERHGRQS